ncbi:MAG: geranylgeranylglycerol-phosphate geranylgeranyltransferase [Chitinispirillaceae bacterium]|jgi:4-hydroxybenzoate polyprenyltransferase|nr:geranylgeranylglycerol-phosphate geranylgeranyltransferase [Chitinispirillaceae bacterium]
MQIDLMRILPYFKIIRPLNALLAGITVSLGYWLGNSPFLPFELILLVSAAMAATGFGNVINDLSDIATDRISHARRPLPSGEMTTAAARLFAVILGFASILLAFFISLLHSGATAIPILLLVIYARFLKGVPLAGNILVSLLVAYALLFGGLGSPSFFRLLIPALLAFLLNFIREILKDIEDEPGDRAAGLSTTATLSGATVRIIISALYFSYLILLFLPYTLHQFGTVYATICAAVIVPLTGLWLFVFVRKSWLTKVSLLSMLIKAEMIAGLVALAADEIL